MKGKAEQEVETRKRRITKHFWRTKTIDLAAVIFGLKRFLLIIMQNAIIS